MPNLPNEDVEKRVVATGPNQGSSVRGVTGFFTAADKLDYGVNVQGNRCGVYGESGNPIHSRTAPIDSREQVGVCGIGLSYGVFGRGFLRAGVYGEIENRGAGVAGQAVGGNAIGVAGIRVATSINSKPTDRGSGIIGVTEGGDGFGVVGLSVDTLIDELQQLGPKVVPQPVRDIDGRFVNTDGSGIGVFGGSGAGVGVQGVSGSGSAVLGSSKSGTGVEANSKSGTAVEANSDSGAAVVGRSTHDVAGFFDSFEKDGVVGHSGDRGDGVRGSSTHGIGVRGEANEGVGVFGDSKDQSGVVGRSRGKTAPGVFGTCEKLTGVAGRSTEAPGVFGDSAKQAGVMGVSRGTSDTSAPGVFGFGIAPFRVPGPPAGVLGLNDNSVGVLGSSGKVIGILGNTDKGLGVVGVANFGAGVPTDQITDQGIAVIGLGNSGFGAAGLSTSGTGIFGSSKTGLAAHFKGPVMIEGDVTIVGGTKSAAVPHPDGSHRQLYCIESPESWFEDFGEARLVNGKAEVRFDRGFAALVKLKGYHVFLTPYGDCKGMFVAKRAATGFRVCEQQGGSSNVRFAYRVVAKRKDVVAQRLAKVTLPKVSKRLQLPDLKLKIKLPDFKRLSVTPFDLPSTLSKQKKPLGPTKRGNVKAPQYSAKKQS